jgi:predicted P-loop ATPase
MIMEFTNTFCHTIPSSPFTNQLDELAVSATRLQEGQGTAPHSEQTISEHIALAATASTSSPAPTPINQVITRRMVERLLEDAVFAALTKKPELATSHNLTAFFGAFKEVTIGYPEERELARERVTAAFKGTVAESLVLGAWAKAGEKGLLYLQLRDLGVPESALPLEDVSPVLQAKQHAFQAILPGGLKESFACLCTILRCNPRVVGGELVYSVMDETATISARPVTDADVHRIREEVELGYRLEFPKTTTSEAVEHVAHERQVHALQDYFRHLRAWDGVPRLGRVGAELLGAEKKPTGQESTDELEKLECRNALVRAQLRKFFIGAVARALCPGCKLDNVLILKGGQGKGKSQFFRVITPGDRFSDTAIDISNKDALLLLRATFIYEWAELSVMRSAKDVQAVKSFLTSCEDTFRPPYGSRMLKRPRHTVIVGTTNDDGFLADNTGSRRFWVVEVDAERIDLEKAAAWRDQLWAEALDAFIKGEQWWLTEEEELLREEENARHEEQDPWEQVVANWLVHTPKQGDHAHIPVKDPTFVTTAEVLSDALAMQVGHWSKGEERRVGAILRRLGYERAERTVDGHRRKGWRKVSR